LIDVQGLPDVRGIALPNVGISNFRYRVTTGDELDQQAVVATIDVGVSVRADQKGTHMSRLVEVVQDHATDMTVLELPTVLKSLTSTLQCDSARIGIAFPLAVPKSSPVTRRAVEDIHDVSIGATCVRDSLEVEVAVQVIATSLCPCSKAVSDYGAHNQRSRICLSVTTTGDDATLRAPTLRQLIDVAEDSASCRTYPLLKRPDERAVTMQAYQTPVFVEDIARNVRMSLRHVRGPGGFSIDIRNEESIHQHDAYARLCGAFE
jgi:GTP cyclohydrolase I